MARRPYRGLSLERALETPGQQLMRENRERAGRLALERIRDADARKHAEGDTDANHDNEETP
jgi:hypothetical protein